MLFERIFDRFAAPFASNRELSSIEKLLVSEESKSEVTIARIRAVLATLIFALNILFYIQAGDGLFAATLLPFMLYGIFSVGFMYKISLINSKLVYQEKYFLGWIKFLMISWDTAFFTWFIHVVYNHNEHFHSLEFITGQWGLTAAFGIFGAVMILSDIFRYDLYSSLFCGAVILAARWIFALLNPGASFPLTESSTLVLIASLTLFTVLSCLISENFRRVILRSKKQESLERYIPEVLARELIEKGEDMSTQGNRSPVTILFSDIRDFTTFSEQIPPEEVIDFLNDYFSQMIDIIFENNGMLDKIMGDGLMAIFGSPFTKETDPGEDALNAVKTAVAMKAKLAEFNQLITSKGYDPINIGIGINTGPAVLGSIGTDKRKEFTAIGDTVNTASRLESYTKEVNTNILISRGTRQYLDDDFIIEDIGKISLKGKREEVEAFKLIV